MRICYLLPLRSGAMLSSRNHAEPDGNHMDKIIQQDTVLVKVLVPTPIHTRLRMEAARTDQTISEAVVTALDAALPNYEREPPNVAA